MAHGSLLRQVFPKGVGSDKNLAFRVLEAWHNLRRTLAEIVTLVAGRFQIRSHAVQCSRRYVLTVSPVPARSPILRSPA
jgi:hypothetical protein